MPESERFDASDERPDEATDPLLWKLALAVADAHGPDGEGCTNLACAGQGWPCAAWNSAQHALRVARSIPAETSPTADTTGSGRPAEPIVGWSTALVPTATAA
ncbi:hypothetical protein MRQ36_30755 [Micromonospora sp. R77]|uniref:hypothetical protein n=1 Tax=Micromonospora sp. R77 TaxID=2925836 RepID=UPI001F607A99|nr:hypothetical protein [Micromonospora sp. R77]MCI4066703.1 hypothetical protein [Micromonospora sp. R77]